MNQDTAILRSGESKLGNSISAILQMAATVQQPIRSDLKHINHMYREKVQGLWDFCCYLQSTYFQFD